MFALLVVAELAAYGAKIGVTLLPPAAVLKCRFERRVICNFCCSCRFGGSVPSWRCCAVARRCAGCRRLAASSALWVALLAVTVIVPHAPVFVGRNFDIHSANGWEALHATMAAPRPTPAKRRAKTARFDQAQRALLQAEDRRSSSADRRARPTSMPSALPAGRARTFFSRSSTADWRCSAISCRSKGIRCVSLIRAKRSRALPLATPRNFAAAVHAVGEIMNKNKDVLLLLMTSHGEPSGFGLRLPNEAIAELTPNEGRGDPQQRGHQEPHRHRIGLLCRRIRAAARQRQHDRAHRRGCQKYLVWLRARTRLDLFRRCVVSAERAARAGIFSVHSTMPAY